MNRYEYNDPPLGEYDDVPWWHTIDWFAVAGVVAVVASLLGVFACSVAVWR